MHCRILYYYQPKPLWSCDFKGSYKPYSRKLHFKPVVFTMYYTTEHIRCIKSLLQEWAIKNIIFVTTTLKWTFFKDHGITNNSKTLRKKHTHTNQLLPASVSCKLHSVTWILVSPWENMKPYIVYRDWLPNSCHILLIVRI